MRFLFLKWVGNAPTNGVDFSGRVYHISHHATNDHGFCVNFLKKIDIFDILVV